MKKTILALLLAGATWVTGCGSSNNFDAISGQPGNPAPIITPTPTTGYFVDGTNGNDATGSFSTGAPYKTLSAATTAAPASAVITVRQGTYNESVTLKNGQQLLGVASGNRPIVTGSVTLGDGNTLDFLSFQGTNGNSVDGSDQNGGTIRNCEFANTTNLGCGVLAQSSTGTWIVEDNVMTDLAGLGVQISGSTGDNIIAQVNGNTIRDSAFCAIGFQTSGTGTMKVQVKDNVMTGNQATATFEVITGNTSDFVAQIVGNTNDDVYRLSRVDATSNLRIERLADLETLNTGTRLDSPGSQTPQDAANGDAGFGTAP